MLTVHEQLSLVILKLAVIDIKSHVFFMRLASLQYYERTVQSATAILN